MASPKTAGWMINKSISDSKTQEEVMNKTTARNIAEKITNEEIRQMFNDASAKTTDWEQTSIVNKSMTKGTAWNILKGGLTDKGLESTLVKTNMIREFGEFLPVHLLPEKKEKKAPVKPFHQEPDLVDLGFLDEVDEGGEPPF